MLAWQFFFPPRSAFSLQTRHYLTRQRNNKKNTFPIWAQFLPTVPCVRDRYTRKRGVYALPTSGSARGCEAAPVSQNTGEVGVRCILPRRGEASECAWKFVSMKFEASRVGRTTWLISKTEDERLLMEGRRIRAAVRNNNIILGITWFYSTPRVDVTAVRFNKY